LVGALHLGVAVIKHGHFGRLRVAHGALSPGPRVKGNLSGTMFCRRSTRASSRAAFGPGSHLWYSIEFRAGDGMAPCGREVLLRLPEFGSQLDLTQKI